MKITVDINRQDYWFLNKFIFLHEAKIKWRMLVNLIAVPVTVFALLLILKFPVYYCFFVAIVGGGLADFWMLYSIKRRVMKMPADKAGFLGQHVIEINEEGIKESTSVNEGIHKWSGIKTVAQDKQNIYIFLDMTQAHIIPKRSFDSATKAEAFFQTAQDYLQKNSGK